jgi:DNA-binding GntR family transcriptional regulator
MIQSASMREQLYTYLRNEIQQGELGPGCLINIDKMSRELGISKTPLKEAIIKLECEGFVNFLPRRGVQVRALTQKELKEYYEVIGYLESGVVYAVFDQLRSPACIRQLKQSNRQQYRALEKKDHDRYYHLNLGFHDIFLKLSDNRTLQELVVPMKKRLYDFPRQTYWADWEKVNLEEHTRFIRCVENDDHPGAAAIIRDEHWGWKKHEPFFSKFYKFDARVAQTGRKR